ncbi:hypothetical protein [Streptomyces gardneri]|uniref:hypothetical protein n=1 Tax=Streptomyces gardneri TaxID=66892 RepID=UPI0035DAA1B5
MHADVDRCPVGDGVEMGDVDWNVAPAAVVPPGSLQGVERGHGVLDGKCGGRGERRAEAQDRDGEGQ